MSSLHAIRQEGYELLHDGMRELSIVEGNGIRIDTKLLKKTKAMLRDKIGTIREDLRSTKEWKVWQKRFGRQASLTSRDQCSTVIFDEIGESTDDLEMTASGRPKMDEESLQKVENDFLRGWCKMLTYEKTLGTFLKGIEKEVVNGRLHPSFNLHTARTYRSSSESPNFQNFPVRNKEIAEIIRSLFIASKSSVLAENDFKGIEVSMSACYHHDPNFISYITTPGKDMHRDMAAQLYCLKPDEVSKDTRYGAKNKFVFPQFYGDFYISCTRYLWEWMEKGELKGPDGDELQKHLARFGIIKRGKCDPSEDPDEQSFEYHVKQVEKDFWERRFQRYGEWKKEFYNEYLERGYFDLKTGFRIYGVHSRNSVVNYPVQGSAFHCLLWTLIQVNRRLRKYKMKSKIVGQIHDSLIGDIRTDELRDYFEIVETVVHDELRKHYTWINVPMEIEYELANIGKSWFDKKEIQFKDGRFIHPDDPEKKTKNAEKFLSVI